MGGRELPLDSLIPRVHDPGRIGLRRAARAAVVAAAAFAIGALVLDNDVAGLIAVFGSFAPLVFADFGGRRGREPSRMRRRRSSARR